MKKALLIFAALLVLCSTCAACGNKEEKLDANAVLTDSDVPLDLGAELDGTVVNGHLE
ncbi:MAG: hypothetical protein PUB99_01605 [Oscillospiraceae bacterium]|nr:hypothetical protein [Oscillospiraceae bacterium]